MLKVHAGSDEYTLWFDDEKPDGVYTNVSVLPLYDTNGSLIGVDYTINS